MHEKLGLCMWAWVTWMCQEQILSSITLAEKLKVQLQEYRLSAELVQSMQACMHGGLTLHSCRNFTAQI